MDYDELGRPDSIPVVLLHGIGLPRQMWQPQLTLLAARHRVFAPDLPGLTGAAGGPAFTFVDAAAAVANLIRTHIRRPAHICGLSLGAMVAMQVAVDAPDVVASLILSGGQVRPPRALMTLQRAIVTVLPKKVLTTIPSAVDERYPDVAAAARTQLSRLGKSGLRHAFRETARLDLRSRLGEIAAPTLVLCGARDRANLPAARRMAAGLADAQLRIVPGAGHVWNLEQPELFARTVADRVADITARAGGHA